MRVRLPDNFNPENVPPVPAVPLSSEASKTLIAGGVFQPNPHHVFYTAFRHAAATVGDSIESGPPVDLAGGIRFQSYLVPGSDDSLLKALPVTARQTAGYLDQAGEGEVADGIAVVMSAPGILHAMISPDVSKTEKTLISVMSAAKVLSLFNRFMPIPHVDGPLQVGTFLFKAGAQVYIACANESAEG